MTDRILHIDFHNGLVTCHRLGCWRILGPNFTARDTVTEARKHTELVHPGSGNGRPVIWEDWYAKADQFDDDHE